MHWPQSQEDDQADERRPTDEGDAEIERTGFVDQSAEVFVNGRGHPTEKREDTSQLAHVVRAQFLRK